MYGGGPPPNWGGPLQYGYAPPPYNGAPPHGVVPFNNGPPQMQGPPPPFVTGIPYGGDKCTPPLSVVLLRSRFCSQSKYSHSEVVSGLKTCKL